MNGTQGANVSDLTVAKTILEQLGGHKFMTMTGAKNFVGSDNALSFRLPGGIGRSPIGINAVRIELTPLDEYDVTFSRIHGTKVQQVVKAAGIHEQELQRVFTETTGLDTRL